MGGTRSRRLPRTLEPGAPMGVIDDYGLYLEALLDVAEATGDVVHLQRANQLAQVLLDRFWDPVDGGFFYTDRTAKSLLIRQKDATDGARPSGASRALASLNRLYALGASSASSETVQQGLEASSIYLERSPAQVPTLNGMLDGLYVGSTEVIIVTPPGRPEQAAPFLTLYNQTYRPHTVLAVVQEGQGGADFSAFKGKKAGKDGVLVYVCASGVCAQPVNSIADMKSALEAMAAGKRPPQ